MKFFFAGLFLFVTFLSVSQPANPICDEFQDSNQIMADQGACYAQADNATGAADSDHHHDVCHSCHLGHCSFLLSSSINLPVRHYTDAINSNSYLFELADFQVSLFRPPIV